MRPAGGRWGPLAAGLLLGALLFVVSPPARADDEPRLVDLRVELRQGSWVASFDLQGGFNDKVLDRIASGLPVTFRSFLEVRKRGMFKPKLGAHVVDVTVDFDSLTKQYRLSREVDSEVVGSSATEKEEEMRRWMSELRDVDLGPPPQDCDDAAPFLRVKGRVDSGFIMIFFPYHKETGWVRTSLPCPQETTDED